MVLTLGAAGPGGVAQPLMLDPEHASVTPAADGFILEIRPPDHLPDHFLPRVERR